MKRAVVAVFCSLFVCLLATASSVHAGGFALYEWSSRGVAMATTGYAVAGDASVIATNPALMTKLDGSHALAGVTLVSPQATVVVDGHKNKTEARIFKVPHAYYTRQMESNENVWFGVGSFTRFGLGTYYDDNWSGRGGLQYVDLESFSLNPNMAFKVNDQLSFATGVEILRGSIKLQKTIAPGVISANTVGYAIGGNLAVHYDFDDQWSAGLTWRAPMKMVTEGTGQQPGSSSGTSGQTIEATLPGSYTLGIGYEPMDNWSWEFDVIHTRWDSVDAMTYSGIISAKDELHYKNTWRFQLGTEYWATDWLALRAGYAYDQTPTRAGDASFMLPSNDRHLLSTGLGFKGDQWNVDWSFMYVMTKGRTGLSISNSVGGTYAAEFKDGKTWISGLSIGYAF
jgi:long-chain fatty acid transport protein